MRKQQSGRRIWKKGTDEKRKVTNSSYLCRPTQVSCIITVLISSLLEKYHKALFCSFFVVL